MPKRFTTKKSKYFTGGTKLVYEEILSIRYLSKYLLDFVDPVIEQNGFFAHLEYLLLAITQDGKKSIREFDLQRILKARLIDGCRKPVRTFTLPKINFSVEEYSKIINWMHCELSSRPLLAEISDDTLRQ